MASRAFEAEMKAGRKPLDERVNVSVFSGPLNPHQQPKMQPDQPIHVEHAPNAGSES